MQLTCYLEHLNKTKMNQKYSIVVPVHNKEKYIHKTLKSIIEQTYFNFELILVNDGSTDLSGEICESYAIKDSRIKVIHQKNGGVSNARNNGIKAASNQLIAFIDADDYWDITFLEQMNELISAFPEILIYSAKFALEKNTKILLGENYFPTGKDLVVFDLIDKCCFKARFPINASSVIIRKEAIERVGYFDDRIYLFEDYDLFLRISLISRIAYLNRRPLSFYNIDVAIGSKARGRVPLLSRHWISFMDKFDDELCNYRNLKLLLDRATLNQMISYRRFSEYKVHVKEILSKVNKSNYGWKYRIIFDLPVRVGDLVLLFYQFLSGLKSQSF